MKSLEHEGDHSSLSSAKVRSVEIYLHSFMSWQAFDTLGLELNVACTLQKLGI